MAESSLFKEISSLATERRNPDTENIDLASAREILEMINAEDAKVAPAVREVIPEIEKAVLHLAAAFRAGGRLFYFGAGTSGRLGVVDASECPPTFGTDPAMVQGVIAGGTPAIFRAQEGAEDSREAGAGEVRANGIEPPDVFCGIAASGRTPWVLGAMEEAARRGCFTIFISTSPREKVLSLGARADVMICPVVGPEAIAGSTRMKSGTAQKLVLNMLTTASMILIGKTYGNVMVDLQLTNKKLAERSKKIIMDICTLDYDSAAALLSQSGGHVKTAIMMHFSGLEREAALALLEKHEGRIRPALREMAAGSAVPRG